ncbi:Pre-rRNA-processing protein esf1 [Elsinoe australis]|uniref:Pre-rRNA-processing protein esf1 n=1 Tax=Elsinoe australis TaxID=40998 RepID=A0A2P7ZDI4_9PEZI|nr:Pre-rRNA-processing protein esf1 [Elsinoe australis]
MAPKPSKRSGDDRFAALSSDPRYRLPSAKNARVAVDKRFSRMFSEGDQDFNRKAKVDKYGRKIKSGSSKEQKNLQRLYQAENDEESEGEEEEEDEDEKLARMKGRGKGKGKNAGKGKLGVVGDSESESGLDEDENVEAELRRVEKYDPARGGGFESSSDESSSDEEDEVEAELADEGENQPQVPMGEVSRRLAVVNLDWDNIRAMDVMAVAGSFVPADGRIESVAIYPSEFGKERLEREELEGPPKEIFALNKDKSRDEEDEESDEEDEEEIKKKLQQGDAGEEFDTAALRRYQLDRLRYYYGVLTCSDEGTAESIYKALDGREYLSTANFFDLRFIPDEVSFDDDKPRDKCASLPAGYKPNEFVTEALTHSKVKLTWDADDATRKEVQKRAFSRAEIDENDLRAYIGNDSESEEDEEVGEDGAEHKMSKKDMERQRMRALLGLGGEKKEPKSNKPVGDMQITFTSGLSGGREGRNGVFENSPPRDESTRERYIRKEKERKAKRRERAKAKRNGEEDNAEKADTSGSDSGSEIVVVDQPNGAAGDDDEKDPFDDPFFNTTGAPSKSQKEKTQKQERIKKREAKQKQAEKEEAERKELELLMDEGNDDKMKHFDMKEIQKAAKKKGKKDRKGKKGQDDAIDDQGAEEVETSDPRFAKLFESHEYAIDPSNPRFQKTEGMKKILEEGRKRRRNATEDEEVKTKKSKQDNGDGADDTQKLLARVKAKSKTRAGR